MTPAEAIRPDPRLVDAIRQRRRLAFVYSGKRRIVETQCYGIGIGTRGTALLRVHQLQDGGQREPLFDVAKIEGLQTLDETFERPGPNYQRDDSAMRVVYAQL